jgi:hypothetical protein
MNDLLLFRFFKYYSYTLNSIKIININFNTASNLNILKRIKTHRGDLLT